MVKQTCSDILIEVICKYNPNLDPTDAGFS